MWPAAAGHTHSGRSGKVDFCVLRVFCVKKYRAEGPREGVLAGDGISQFFLRIFRLGTHACGCVPAKFFSQPNGDRPVPIGQREATTEEASE